MSYGLQVLDSSGNLRLDINDRTPRLKVTVTAVSVPSTSGGTTTVTVTGAQTTDVAITDLGAPAIVSSTNTVTVYGTESGGTTNLRVLTF